MVRPKVEAQLIDGLYVVGDLAYTPEEWAKRERDNARRQRNRDKLREQVAKWRANNPERARELNREHMRRQRAGDYRKLQVIGSLHSLKCSGPTTRTGCRCKKQLIVREVEK